MTSPPRTLSLPRETELRFDVEVPRGCTLTLQRGSAELFGTPLQPQQAYALGPGRFAVWTWYGCEVTLEGSGSGDAYVTEVGESGAMVAAVNVHARLEREREEAQAGGRRGPVLVLAGPTDSGKSTLCRILLAYAARKGRRPVFVDLDPGQGDVAPVGCVAAITVDMDSISVEDGPSTAGALVYFYGYTSPQECPDMYRRLVERINSVVEARFAVDPVSQASGIIVNTCGWVEGEGYRLLQHACRALHGNVVLVMGQADKLTRDLKNDLSGGGGGGGGGGDSPINVVKMPTSGGVQTRTAAYRKRARDAKVREYFYGAPGGPELSPHVITLGFDQVVIVKAPSKGDIPDESMRPVGRPVTLDLNDFRVVEPNLGLQTSILAVSHAVEKSEIPHKNVAGFVHVQQVDMERKQIKVLSPQQGPLPGKFLVMGGVKWVPAM